MNSLSLQTINASSSYEVSAVNDGCYQFFTDYGVHCTVEFARSRHYATAFLNVGSLRMSARHNILS